MAHPQEAHTPGGLDRGARNQSEGREVVGRASETPAKEEVAWSWAMNDKRGFIPRRERSQWLRRDVQKQQREGKGAGGAKPTGRETYRLRK